MHEKNQELIEALDKCVAECNHCVTACLDELDVNMLVRCIKLNISCAEICKVAASFVAREAEHSQVILKECAEICESCAEECEKHFHILHCKTCAEACRNCIELCGVAA